VVKYIWTVASAKRWIDDMNSIKEALKSGMIEIIRSGGAWFTTRKDKFVKIGFSEPDNCYFARECFFKEDTLEGGAYSFGTDWFDISFHGKYIDIYVDPDTFKQWPVSYSAGRGTSYDRSEEPSGQAERMLKFCKRADREALLGITDAYEISGTNFDHIISVVGDKQEQL
jgi:hypothetical protein